ncbi:MAG: alpha/beta hydrolase [Plectolyngbya sp. WJT66-NPBG17]|jgi:pimeloyl-ACP methyl ester carboxylesterase|nr:alpha/beta hydrolase [Plectolyngbya sp. WJT66-NPBG17]MBW4528620.1 alpha/beta hydrolase [Phormidium tanganyikae FI6-MK23]
MIVLSWKKAQKLLLCLFAFSAIVGISIYSTSVISKELPQASSSKPAIVLVHGAYADGTSWQHVIPLLEQDGYRVTAAQIPLTSLPDDVATTKRVIEDQKGTVVVVGHSYAGNVITGAAAGNPRVKALVYVNAFAPEAGETANDLNKRYAAPPISTAIVADAANFLYVDREKFHEFFAQDVSDGEARVMAATQKPIASAAFEQSVSDIAWKTIPSWFLVTQSDRAINPELQRFMAKRIGAKTTEVNSSHVPFISHPREVAKVIEAASTGVK